MGFSERADRGRQTFGDLAIMSNAETVQLSAEIIDLTGGAIEEHVGREILPQLAGDPLH